MKPGWQLSALLALALPAAATGAPDFENQDPLRWLQEESVRSGFTLKTFQPREPVQLPLRNPDGTVWSAEGFPDAATANPVLAAVDAYLALGASTSDDEFAATFRLIADAALAWARPVVGPSSTKADQDHQIRALKELGNRLLINGFAPPFHEFYADRISGDASVSDYIGCSGGQWSVGEPLKGNVISVVYKDGYDDLSRERFRAHEWTHVVDYARLGLVDEGGVQIRALTSRDAFFSEAKAYAVSFLVGQEKGYYPDFADYLRSHLSGYYWVKNPKGFRFTIGELVAPTPESVIGSPPRYFRTIALNYSPARP